MTGVQTCALPISAVQTQRPAAVKAAWSSVYNDVTVQYLSGLGYSIKSVPDITNDHSTTTFRLPKADTHYDYYTAGGASDSIDKTAVDTLRSGVGRLASDVLTTNQSLKIKLSDKSGGNNLGVNDEEGNKLYLLANPFMTYLDMQEFLRVNTVFAPAYWLMTADKQAGVIMAESISSSSTDAATSIAPMQGFFVRLADGVNANPEIYYTAAMMTDPISEGTLTRANDGISQLYIKIGRAHV